nr:helix-turn-helix domain-containing protein [Actinomycetota bacterium]
MDVISVMRLLDAGKEHPQIAKRYRGLLATQHAMRADAEWRWSAQPADGDEVAAVLIAAMPLAVQEPDGAVVPAAAGTSCFLHPHREISVVAESPGTVMCVWVPWDALAEIEAGVRAPSTVIPPSALGRGLSAFVTSLLTQQFEPTVYTGYLVERLIVEMVFSVLVEAAPRVAVDGRKDSSIDRARSLMLVRRAEREFGVEALARDMHMSVRQLPRLFAAEGSAPAEELRRIRVELARELMSDADYAPLGIAEIAEHSGFVDAAGLRRAFALAGLPSPRAVRRAARV